MFEIPPWSHSTLNSFETCPRRHYLTKVVKQVKEPPTEATIWGNFVHKAIEERLRDDKQLPDSIKGYEPLVNMLSKKPGIKLIEHKFALDKNLEPTDWATSWGRGIVDFGVVQGTRATMLDWKTGKRKTDSAQMKLMALMTMHTFKEVDQVYTGFVWLKDSKVDQELFTRNQVNDMWGEFMPKVIKLENAYNKDVWQPKPSGLCKSWCPCTGCEFNGKRSDG